MELHSHLYTSTVPLWALQYFNTFTAIIYLICKENSPISLKIKHHRPNWIFLYTGPIVMVGIYPLIMELEWGALLGTSFPQQQFEKCISKIIY